MSGFVITLCLLLGVTTLITCVQGITITTRAQWHAKSPKRVTKISSTYLPVPFVVIHHSTGNTYCKGKECADAVRNIQAQHMGKSWDDIGYNFLVAPTGEIFEGRGWGVKGSHSIPYNSKSIGICVIGNYMDETPSAKALQSVKDLIQFGVSSNNIKSSYTLIGHRQGWPTLCPGDKLFNVIKTWPHWKNV